MAREQEAALRETLRAGRYEPFGIALEAVCDVELDRVKTRLLDALPDEVATLQGEGRAIRKILKYLTERPLPQPQRFDNEVAPNI
jgi:hypothetical protein